MPILDMTAVRDDFSTTVNKVAYAEERVVIARHGKPVAALISLEDLKLLELLEDNADLDAARKALAEAGDVRLPWKQVKKQLGL